MAERDSRIPIDVQQAEAARFAAAQQARLGEPEFRGVAPESGLSINAEQMGVTETSTVIEQETNYDIGREGQDVVAEAVTGHQSLRTEGNKVLKGERSTIDGTQVGPSIPLGAGTQGLEVFSGQVGTGRRGELRQPVGVVRPGVRTAGQELQGPLT